MSDKEDGPARTNPRTHAIPTGRQKKGLFCTLRGRVSCGAADGGARAGTGRRCLRGAEPWGLWLARFPSGAVPVRRGSRPARCRAGRAVWEGIPAGATHAPNSRVLDRARQPLLRDETITYMAWADARDRPGRALGAVGGPRGTVQRPERPAPLNPAREIGYLRRSADPRKAQEPRKRAAPCRRDPTVRD